MEEILKKYPLLRGQDVPRETFMDFERFIVMKFSKSKIVSRETFKWFIREYFFKISSIKL